MKTSPSPNRLATCLLLTVLVLTPLTAGAHCDRLDGPVARAAREALEADRFEAVQIWVAAAQEGELRAAFDRALEARAEGPAAAALADRYLVETAVRLHRDAEGMSYQGVKPAGMEVPADIRLGDEALETGNLEPVLAHLEDEMDHKTRDLFEEARAARARRTESVEAGREWVDAYVRYIVFVHGVQQTIDAGPAHGVGHAD